MTLRVKICGIRTLADAEAAIDVGADLLGFNLIESSPRYLPEAPLAELLRQLARTRPNSAVETVAVVADRDVAELERILSQTGVGSVQLHGSEAHDSVERLAQRAFKALRIGDAADVALARVFPGARLLVDAKVKGQLGGSGVTFDWSLVQDLVAERDVIVAGGLNPDNVADAVRTLRPFGVDVASGVETSPGVKDSGKLALFVERAKSA
jgi:phosphoribosylanthranilate isomerase